MNRKGAEKTSKETKKLTNATNEVNKFIQEIEKFFDDGEIYEQVVQMCDEGESKFPEQATTFWYYKAMCLDQLKKGDEAEALMKSVLNKEPKHTGARSWFVSKDFEKKFDLQKTRLDSDLLNRLKAYANEIASNQDLVSLIKGLNESLEPFLSVTKSTLDYQKKMKEAREKGDTSEIHYSSFKASLGDINEISIERFRDLEKRIKELRQDNLEDYTKFRSLFFFLSRLDNIKKYANDLKEITSTVGVNYENLEYFYKIFDKTEKQDDDDDDNDNDDDDEKNEKKHENVEMPTDFPVFKQPPFDKTSKPLAQILDTLCLDIRDENEKSIVTQEEIEKYVNLEEKNIFDAISIYKQKFASNAKLISLLEAFEKVKKYSQEWENKSAADIRNWADSCRGSLNNNFEAIAVMDRANSLLTGGHYLRHPQIISLLLFLETNSDEGKLLQINTGEGKTLIVSLFVAIQILKGETVDVITSSSLLAEEGVKERRKFFNLLNISVSYNNTDKRDEGFDKNPYIADVLYGCISNFQFDYLRDSFECKGNRAKRKFGTVMIDEVDSMLIDNGGHIAKLSGPLPGMDNLRYIYIKIWTEVIKQEQQCQNDLENSRNNLKDITDQINSKVKDAIDLSQFKMIPSHLVEYAKSKLDIWVKNAIYARFYCHQDKQYVIKKVKDLKEDVVVPVDFENTGVTLKNTIWSHGLHQFVQLKHNLYLTSESLTSSFISNIGYIKNYQRIFGLSGTLGSLAEQDLLASVYNIQFAKVPTYRAKKFHELPLLVAHDLSSRVAIEASIMCEEGRAVLVICETIRSLKNIEQMIKTLNAVDSVQCNIKTFPDEDSSKVTETKIQPGDVIISTNIAGRGTDFKTSEELELNGGLHVIVAFLPCNKRVEDQAFGRTARQGKSGTAQIIIHEDEILNDFNPGIFFKQARDEQEKARINQIKTVQLAEINFNDKIFSLFSEVYVQLYKKHKKDPIYPFYLNDLKEFWAFWLDKNNANGKKNDQAEADFGRFKADASEILNGKIKHNPYYCIKQANAFINNDKEKEAKEVLENAISMATNSEILYPAHLKLFELAMEGGKQLTERFSKAMSNLIFLPYKMDEKYKDDAKKHLAAAQKAIKVEADYLASLFEAEDFRITIWEPEEKNFLVKHLKSRLACLLTYSGNLESLSEQLDSSQGLTIQKKIYNYLNECDDAEIKKNITNSEINELDFTGLNEIYSLREVFDVAPQIITGAQVQIGLGLAALAAGIAFPPALVICAPLAGTLISEGICDIIIELISKGETDYDWKEHVKSKCISYGISIVTMGLSAVATSTKLLNQAAKLCRGMSKVFAQSPFIRNMFNKIVNLLEKSVEKLAKAKKLSKALVVYDKAEKAAVIGISRSQAAKHILKRIGTDIATGAVSSIIDSKLITPALQEMFKSLKPQIREKIKQRIESDAELEEKLEKNKREKIEKTTEDILGGDIGELVVETAKEISIGVIKSSKNKWLKAVALSLDSLDFTNKILTYAEKFCKELKQQLSLSKDSESVNRESALEVIIANLADQLTEKLFGFIVGLGAKFTSTIIKDPLLNKVFEGKNKDENNNNQSKKTDHDEVNQNQPKRHELIDQHLSTLGIDANINDLSTADIARAFKEAVLNAHPDKRGSSDSRKINELQVARNFLLNYIRRQDNSHTHHRENGAVNNNELKMLIHGNSDKNQCGQMVFAELFQVDTHDLSRKTGMTNSYHGSHISDHEHQFRTLDLEPAKYDFQNSNKQDLVKFLNEANASAAMLFVNRNDMPDELGHVFLVRKQGNDDIVAYDRNKLILFENLFEYKGMLLTGKNLDDHLTRIQHEIIINPDAHPPVSQMRSTGQDEFEDRFGVLGKNILGQINENKMMTNDSLMVCSVTRNLNHKDYNYVLNQAKEDKIIKFDLQKHNNIEKSAIVRYSSNGPGTAHYCPFVKNTHDWTTLKQSEVTLSNMTPEYNCMLTGGTMHSLHSMCSFLICIGTGNIRVYCDSHPTSNANQKVQSILADGARVIHRIDHAANMNIDLPNHNRDFYGSNDSMTSGDIYLHHKKGQWIIMIQNKSFNMDGVELPVGNIRKIRTDYYSDLLGRIQSDENNALPIFNPKNKTRAFGDDPQSFLNSHYLLQLSSMSASVYINEAITAKSLRFDIFPGNIVNQRQMFKILPNEQGQHQAHYCPYFGNTHDWSSLRNSETIVKLTNPQHNYVLTDTFSGCSFIVAVGKHDVKVYHDSKPELNIAEKNAGIHSDGENRHIIRVDHHDYKITDDFSYISSEMPSQRLFYGIVGDINSIEVDSENPMQARTGQIILFYHQSEWNIAISSYLAVNINDNGQIPIDLNIFKLSDLVQ